MNNKPLDYYLNAQYTIILEPGPDGWYGGEILEIPECIAQGQTPEETLSNLEEARRLLIEWNYEDKKEIPVPAIEQDYSRSYLLRMSPSLHRQLKKNAEREGSSLNKYINDLLTKNSSVETATRIAVETTAETTARIAFEGFERILSEKTFFQAARNTEIYEIGVGLYLESMLILVGQEKGLFKNFKVRYLPWDGDFFQSLGSRDVHMIIGNEDICKSQNRTYSDKKLYQYQETLCSYKGFAIMVHESSGMNSFLSNQQKYPDNSIPEIIKNTLQQLKGKKIIAAQKTDHKASLDICLPENGGLKNDEYTVIGDYEPNEGLKKFLDGEADAYVGGIPQRVIALCQGKVELISQSQTMSFLKLIQVNGLITNTNDNRVSSEVIDIFFHDWKSIVKSLYENKNDYCYLLVEKFNEEFSKYREQLGHLEIDLDDKFKIDPNVFIQYYADKYLEEWEQFPRNRAETTDLHRQYFSQTKPDDDDILSEIQHRTQSPRTESQNR